MSQQANRSLLRNTLSISAVLYLSLHVAASFVPGRLWGVDALAYQVEWSVPFAVLSLALLLTTAGDKVPAQIFRVLDSAVHHPPKARPHLAKPCVVPSTLFLW